MDICRQFADTRGGNTTFGGAPLRAIVGDERNEILVACRVRVDEILIDPAAGDEFVGDTVKKPEIRLRADRDMIGRGHRRFGATRINDDDAGRVRVAHHPLPHDRVRNRGIGSDEHHDVAVFKVRVGVGRRIKAERLFIGDVSGRHALTRIAVRVQAAHAEFKKGAKQSHLLGRDLPGRQERDAVRAVFGLHGLHAVGERGDRGGPVYRSECVRDRVPQ